MSVKFEFNNIDEENIIETVDLDERNDDEIDIGEVDLDKENIASFSPKRELEDDEYHDYCEPYLQFTLLPQNLNVLTNLISTLKEHEWEEDRYDWHDQEGNDYEDYRYCGVVGLCEDEDSDVFELIRNLFELANEDNFNYDLDGDTLDIQLLRYREGGQYNWHADYGLSANSERGMTRKLSVSIQLSEESDYEGGDLEFIDYCGRHSHSSRLKGSGVVFDSRLPHRANIIKSGERFALVAWASGPQLR